MELELVELKSGRDSGLHELPVFDWSVTYENEHWWSEPCEMRGDQTRYFQVLQCGTGVARVELDDPGEINPEYANLPMLDRDQLEVLFFEVAIAARRRGMGRASIKLLEQHFPDRQFFAYSEGVDPFWAALGWKRYVHTWMPNEYQALFIQS